MNGWSNRATWVISLWFYPENKNDVLSIKDFVEEKINGLDNWLKDLIDDEINWDELIEKCDEEE